MNESTTAMFEGDEEIRRLLEMQDGPCDVCEIGIYEHEETRNIGHPAYFEIWRCNNPDCGHSISFP